MMIPERKLDYIIAYDSSGELMPYDYVNGTTFGQSAKVAHNLGLPFPDVPNSPTFLNLGLNIYPVSFAIKTTHILLIQTTDILRLQCVRRYAARLVSPQFAVDRVFKLFLHETVMDKQSAG